MVPHKCESFALDFSRKELKALIGNWKLFKHDTNLWLLDQQRNFSSRSLSSQSDFFNKNASEPQVSRSFKGNFFRPMKY